MIIVLPQLRALFRIGIEQDETTYCLILFQDQKMPSFDFDMSAFKEENSAKIK